MTNKREKSKGHRYYNGYIALLSLVALTSDK